MLYKKVDYKNINCKKCNKEFKPKNKTQLFCSEECCKVHHFIEKTIHDNIICKECGKEFKQKHTKQIFCSKKCSNDNRISIKKHITKNINKKDLKKDLPTSTIGSIHEIIICADLMANGYYVFRSMSPNSPCDIIAMRNGVTYKIEVTTGYRLGNGKLSCPEKGKKYDYNIIAVVSHDGSFVYIKKDVNIFPPDIDCICIDNL